MQANNVARCAIVLSSIEIRILGNVSVKEHSYGIRC
jgi:hypothetical protein